MEKIICFIIGHKFGGKSNPKFKRETIEHNLGNGEKYFQTEMVCNRCGTSENELWGSVMGVTNDNLFQRATYLIRFHITRGIYRLLNPEKQNDKL